MKIKMKGGTNKENKKLMENVQQFISNDKLTL